MNSGPMDTQTNKPICRRRSSRHIVTEGTHFMRNLNSILHLVVVWLLQTFVAASAACLLTCVSVRLVGCSAWIFEMCIQRLCVLMSFLILVGWFWKNPTDEMIWFCSAEVLANVCLFKLLGSSYIRKDD